MKKGYTKSEIDADVDTQISVESEEAPTKKYASLRELYQFLDFKHKLLLAFGAII